MGRIVVAGASGLVGRLLVRSLEEEGRKVVRLVRRAPLRPDEIRWNPETGELAQEALDGCEAVVNLSGESISVRWTAESKRRILSSRVATTELLAKACARGGVQTMVSASAVGYYGDRGDELLDESSPCGGGFLAETCLAWEHALHPARSLGIRTVSCRFGVILSRSGGALPRMLPAFRCGAGGPLGSGRQWLSWIHERDAVSVLRRVLSDPSLQGPVLGTAPTPSRQREFAQALGRRLGRPAVLRTPAWVLRLALGGMAEELLLASQRCQPEKLREMGFRWQFPTLEAALADLV